MNKYLISENSNIREAIKKIDSNGEGFVFVTNSNNKVTGILTDGDFRRAVLKGISLEESCRSISNKDFKYLSTGYSRKDVINTFLQSRIMIIPILENKELTRILYRGDYDLSDKVLIPEVKDDITVVIMAGGKGTRMKPFTNILPKPLIPVGDKSMLEIIMNEYDNYFDCKYFISVNYKANLIKAYFEEFNNKYTISYLHEVKPLGTGGAIKQLEGKVSKPFFVSNCDILIKADYQKIYETHLSQKNDITIIASMIHYKVPYGVCKIGIGGELLELIEKPEYDFLVNAGMYILNPDTLQSMPEDTFYNITDLINSIKQSGGRVGVYPVSEKSYLDSGQWKEYGMMLDEMNKNKKP